MADDDATRARRTTKAAGRAAKKAGAKKTPVKKAAAATPPAPPAKKAATRKAATGKASAKKAATGKAAPAKQAAPGKKAGRGGTRGAVLAPPPKKAPAMRLAAEQPLEDDWEAPEPEPSRDDPHARIRSVLRAAALEVEARSAARAAPATPTPAARVPRPAPAPPVPSADEPVTRVLVAPVPADDEDLEEEEEDWPAPEVLEEERPAIAAPPPPPPPAPPAPPGPQPPHQPATTFEPAPVSAPEKKAGAGLSVAAILLALVVPLVGAIVGFVLARRAKARAAPLAGAAGVISVLALVAWLVGGGVLAYAALRDQGVDYSQLKVGDCFDSAQSNEIRGIKVKSCDQPHNSEIFFIVTHPAGPNDPYPGKDALVQYAADNCLGQPLTEYLGIPLEQSQLKDFEIVPQESAWKDGRRVLVCGLDTGGQGAITGSVRGTRR